MIKGLRTLFIGLTAVLVTVACDVKKVKKQPHDDAVALEYERNEAVSTLNADLKSFHQNRSELFKLIDSEPFNYTDVKNRVINPLMATLISSDLLDRPENRDRDESTTALSLLNYALFTASKESSEELSKENFLKLYKDKVFEACDDQLKECRLTRFFKRDRLTAEILLLYANGLSQVIEGVNSDESRAALSDYYRVVQMSYYLRNGKSSENWNFAYLKHQKEYETLISTHRSDDASIEAQLEKHRNLVGYILSDLERTARLGQGSEQYCNYMTRVNPLEQIMLGQSEKYRDGILRAVAGHIRCLKQSGSLKPTIERYVTQTKSVLNQVQETVVDRSRLEKTSNIFLQAEVIEKHAPVNMLKNFQVSLDFSDPFAFIIIDRYFNEGFDLSFASELFKEVELKNKEQMLSLLSTLRNYLKIKMLFLTHLSYKQMGDFYKKRSQSDYDSAEFFEEFLKDSVSVNIQWTDFKRRADRVTNFIVSSIEPSISSFYDDNDQQRREITKLFNDKKVALSEIRKNINFIVVWPLQAILVYHMSKYVDEVIEIKSPYLAEPEKKDKGYTELFTYFGGVTKPVWLPYGDPQKRLGPYEIVISFSYALKAGLFEYFQATDDTEKSFVNESQWIKKATEVYLSSIVNDLNKYSTNLDGVIRGAPLRDFESACRDPYVFSDQLDLVKDLEKHVFFPLINQGSRSSSHFVNGFFSGNLQKVGETTINLKQRSKYLQAFHKVITDYANSGLDKSERFVDQKDQIVSEAFESLDAYKLASNTYMRKLLTLKSKIADCPSKLLRYHYERQKDIYDYEIDFLKSTHAHMTLLRYLKSGNTDVSESALREYYQELIGALSGEEQNLAASFSDDVITRILATVSSSVTYEDLLNRLRKEISPQVDNSQLYSYVAGISDIENVDSQISLSESSLAYSKWSILFRIRNYLSKEALAGDLGGQTIAPNLEINLGAESQLPKKFSSMRTDVATIQYNVNQQAFVRSAMNFWNGRDSAFIKWMTSTANAKFLFDQINLQVLLYKAGAIEIGEKTCDRVELEKIDGGTGVCETHTEALDDIVKNIESLIDTINVDERNQPLERRMRTYLDWLDADSRYKEDVEKSTNLVSNFVDPVTKNPNDSALFDFFYKSYMLDELKFTGTTRLKMPMSYSKMAMDMKNRPYLLFSGYETVLQHFRPFFREYIVEYFDKIKEFEDKIREKELKDREQFESDNKEFLRVVYERVSAAPNGVELIDGEWLHISPKLRSDQSPIYLREFEKNWVKSFARKYFIDDTKCGLLPNSGEVDAPAEIENFETLNCNDKYESWSKRWEN